MKDQIAHSHGLAHDLIVVERQMLERRKVLRMLASTGIAALLPGCGGASSTDSISGNTTSGSITDATLASSSASTLTGSTTTSSSSTASNSCLADPTETAGPYPGDGTNRASGSTSNVLTSSGIVRSDIRSSFLTTTTTASGTRVDLTITLVDVNNSCAPLAGYAIYLWHCDVNGNYSLYSAPAESYLRGVQVTNASGQVAFTTIFPGCYPGRYPHIHFEVYQNLAAATNGRNALLTSQFALPASACNAIYANTTLYPRSAKRFAQISTATDGVFADNTASQIAQQTPTFTNTSTGDFSATALVGIRV